MIERAFETRFSKTKCAMSSSFICVDPLIHDFHSIHDNVHDSSIASPVTALDTHLADHRAISANSQQSQQSEQSQPFIIVVSEQDNVDEKFCVGKSRSTRRRRRNDDDKDGISVVLAMQANNDDNDNGDDGINTERERERESSKIACRSVLFEVRVGQI